MLKHFQTLCNLCGTSGDESAVRMYLVHALEQVEDVSWIVDPLGNLLVKKKGKNRAPHKLMISAHMDEVGMIVMHVNKDGTLCIAPVGGIDASAVVGRQVLVGKDHIHGVIGSKPIHLLTKEEKETLPKFENLVIDIGATEAAQAMQFAPTGTYVYFMPDFQELGGNRFCSKAIDDRIGCALLLTLLEKEAPYDFVAAFLVQEEIGLRGARTAAFSVEPELALVLEATTAADLAGATEEEQVCRLGGGAVIPFMDRSTIYDRELVQLAFSTCEKYEIPCQTKSRIAGGNDSGAIHISRGGVRTISVSLPCRYLHGPSSVADWSDVAACETLLPRLAQAMIIG